MRNTRRWPVAAANSGRPSRAPGGRRERRAAHGEGLAERSARSGSSTWVCGPAKSSTSAAISKRRKSSAGTSAREDDDVDARVVNDSALELDCCFLCHVHTRSDPTAQQGWTTRRFSALARQAAVSKPSTTSLTSRSPHRARRAPPMGLDVVRRRARARRAATRGDTRKTRRGAGEHRIARRETSSTRRRATARQSGTPPDGRGSPSPPAGEIRRRLRFSRRNARRHDLAAAAYDSGFFSAAHTGRSRPRWRRSRPAPKASPPRHHPAAGGLDDGAPHL